MLPQFLHAVFLEHPAVLKQLGMQAKGAVMPGLNMGIIRALEMRVPPVQLQKEFAQRVGCLKDLQHASRTHASNLNAIFSSLQHRAFQGQL
jgi:type I restriction enzyme S subunit